MNVKATPVFGKTVFRSRHADTGSPIRDGIYVETIERTGGFNRGTWYRLTDGHGKFWEYRKKSVIELSDQEERKQ